MDTKKIVCVYCEDCGTYHKESVPCTVQSYDAYGRIECPACGAQRSRLLSLIEEKVLTEKGIDYLNNLDVYVGMTKAKWCSLNNLKGDLK